MASAGSIFVDVLLNDSRYSQGWNRARNTTKQGVARIQGDVNVLNRAFGGLVPSIDSIGRAAANLGATLGAALSVRAVVNYSDTWKLLESRLNLATGSMAETARVQSQLLSIAQQTSTPLKDSIDGYVRLSQSLKDTEKKQYDLVRVTELMSKTLALSGTNAAGAATFFQQFGQAASSDFKAVGQELQTFADQNPRFLKAIKVLEQETGKSLKQMASDGELSTKRIIDALVKSGDAIDAEAGTLGLTVGKALTQLDNAFLAYIGNSQAVASGTGSLALGIKTLADNFELLANAVTLVAGVMAVRMVGALGASSVAFTLNLRQIILYQAALARMAGLASTAAVSQLALAGALARTNAAMALLGGAALGGVLIGLGGAVLVTQALREENNLVARSQELYNDSLAKSSQFSNEYITASNERRKQIKQETADLLTNTEIQLNAYFALAKAFNEMSRLERGAWRVRGFVDPSTPNFDKLESTAAQNASLIEDLRSKLNGGFDSIDKLNGGGGSGGGGSDISRYDKLVISADKWLSKEREVLAALQEESTYVGMTTHEIEMLKDARQFEANTAEKVTGLRDKDRERILAQAEALKQLRQEAMQTNYEVSRSAETGLSNFLSTYVEDSTDAAKNVETVMSTAFKGAEDAWVEFTQTGKLSFKSLADSIIADLARMQFRQFTSSLINLGGGSGGFSGIFDLFDGFFANGGNIGAGRWGVVGENGPELAFGGSSGKSIVPLKSGGGQLSNNTAVVFNVINNNNSEVKTSKREDSSGISIDVMIDDLVAQKISKSGSRTNQALTAYSRRGLTRR